MTNTGKSPISFRKVREKIEKQRIKSNVLIKQKNSEQNQVKEEKKNSE